MNVDYKWILLTLAVSFLVTFIAVPIVKMIAEKIGAVDVPKDNRRMHKKPIPRLGGLAMIYGFFVSILCFTSITPEIRGILIGCLILGGLGVIDDIHPLGAKLKLAVQTIAAIIPVLSGVSIAFFSVPKFIDPSGMLHLNPIVGAVISVIWIIAITNAVNLIDGLDGLAAGVSSIASMSILFIAVINSNSLIAVLAAALVGSCLGFLPFNVNPAKIFMGDTGSTFLGYILATMSIYGLFKGYALITFVAPFLILGLPIFDTAFAIIRRIIHHRPIMGADRGHLHHRLIDMGFSQKQTVAILYSITSLLGLSAIIMSTSGTMVQGIFLLVSVALFLGVGFYFSRKPNANQEDGTSSAPASAPSQTVNEEKPGENQKKSAAGQAKPQGLEASPQPKQQPVAAAQTAQAEKRSAAPAQPEEKEKQHE